MANKRERPTTVTSAVPAIIPCSCSTSSATLERCSLRPGNVHSADDWEGVLKPVVVRYKGRKVRLYFRGDAAFASPEMYEYLEAEGFLYAIRLSKRTRFCRKASHICSRDPSAARPTMFALLRQLQLSGWKLGQEAARVVAKVEWHPGELVPSRRFHRHQPVAFRRAGGGVL